MGKMSETVIALSPMLSRHPAQRARGGGAGGRHKTALARLHSGGSLNRSHAYAAEGGVSLGKGQRVRIKCGVAFCCAHVEVKEK